MGSDCIYLFLIIALYFVKLADGRLIVYRQCVFFSAFYQGPFSESFLNQRGSVNKAHFVTQPNLLITSHN